MKRALQTLLAKRSASGRSEEAVPPNEMLDMVVETSKGDIRSASMALQFACIALPATSSGKKGLRGRNTALSTKKGQSTSAVLQSVTRREQSLALFHIMGKIMYNKRRFAPFTLVGLDVDMAAKARVILLQAACQRKTLPRNAKSMPNSKIHRRCLPGCRTTNERLAVCP